MAQVYIFAFGIVMMILNVWFWILEVNPFMNEYKAKKVSKGPFKQFRNALLIISLIPLLIPLGIDLAVTIFCSSFMGFGAGALGGIIGLTMSNIISIYIIIKQREM